MRHTHAAPGCKWPGCKREPDNTPCRMKEKKKRRKKREKGRFPSLPHRGLVHAQGPLGVAPCDVQPKSPFSKYIFTHLHERLLGFFFLECSGIRCDLQKGMCTISHHQEAWSSGYSAPPHPPKPTGNVSLSSNGFGSKTGGKLAPAPQGS